jgi:hypothetical protein
MESSRPGYCHGRCLRNARASFTPRSSMLRYANYTSNGASVLWAYARRTKGRRWMLEPLNIRCDATRANMPSEPRRPIREQVNTLICILVVIPIALVCRSARADDGHAQTLSQALAQYRASQHATVQALVSLDAQMRGLGTMELSWKPEYAELGLFLNIHTKRICYSGKLLADAHRIDPDSGLRQSTLYAEVLPLRKSYIGMPNPEAALLYLDEFPSGPFATEVLLVLANFHKDLLIALKRIESQGRLVSYKRTCYGPYMTDEPLAQQAEQVQAAAVSYYQRVLAREPANRTAKRFLDQIEEGTVSTWSYCSD